MIPTYNEAANIGPLLAALDQALAGIDAEYVVVDDASKDGTARLAAAASRRARVVVRTGERGLATAVVRGVKESRGEFVAVMDADFQHPPAAVRALLDRAREASWSFRRSAECRDPRPFALNFTELGEVSGYERSWLGKQFRLM
ncbi:MAG: glycosyltransferase, partial [Thermoplasmatota archaeon]